MGDRRLVELQLAFFASGKKQLAFFASGTSIMTLI
jgi:hypothetical protein